MLGWIVLLIVLALFAYIRLAPSDPARWHRQASVPEVETRQMKGGYVWRKPVDGDGRKALSALDQTAMAADRRSRLAGSVEDGQITYVSRSKVVGFPDYTTATLIDTEGGKLLEVYGRLRFGRSDFGVNAKRVKGWVKAAQL